MKKLILALMLLSFTTLLSACLQTRQSIKEGATVTEAEQEKAQQAAAYMDYEEQIRILNGRIETLENTMRLMSEAKNHRDIEREQMKADFDEKLKVYAESIAQLENKVLLLTSQINAMTSAKAAGQAAKAKAKAEPFTAAESLFDQKKWREAIVEYQNYRDRYPKGRNYPEATYKIGVAFQELGMKEEAKAFYSEVTKKFPKSKASDKSQYRLKNL